MAISAVLTVAFFGGVPWVITNVGMKLLFGRNPQYRAYRQQDGDPFCDSLPWPMKSDEKLPSQRRRKRE